MGVSFVDKTYYLRPGHNYFKVVASVSNLVTNKVENIANPLCFQAFSKLKHRNNLSCIHTVPYIQRINPIWDNCGTTGPKRR